MVLEGCWSTLVVVDSDDAGVLVGETGVVRGIEEPSSNEGRRKVAVNECTRLLPAGDGDDDEDRGAGEGGGRDCCRSCCPLWLLLPESDEAVDDDDDDMDVKLRNNPLCE